MASNVPLQNRSLRSSHPRVLSGFGFASKFSDRKRPSLNAAAQWPEHRAKYRHCTVYSRNFRRSGKEGEGHTWLVPAGTRAGATAIAKSSKSGVYGGIRKLGMQRSTFARPKQLKKTTTCAVSMIGPDSRQTLFTILTGCAAIGQVLEARTKWGGRVSGPLLAMGAGVILSGTGVIPPASPVYDMVFSTIMPVGAALTLLETDVWSAFSEAGSTLKAFWFGALGTILGTVLSFKVMGPLLGPDGWKIASSLCASYVGGTINYAATAQVLGLNSTHLLAAGMAADNLAMALYFGIIMSIPDDSKDLPTVQGVTGPFDIPAKDQDQPTVESLAMALAAATAACLIGDSLASLLPPSFAGSGLAIMAVVASVFNALAAQLFGSTGGSFNWLEGSYGWGLASANFYRRPYHCAPDHGSFIGVLVKVANAFNFDCLECKHWGTCYSCCYGECSFLASIGSTCVASGHAGLYHWNGNWMCCWPSASPDHVLTRTLGTDNTLQPSQG